MSLDRKVHLLAQYPLLSNANQESLRNLAQSATFREFTAGETVLDRSETVDGIYVVAHGQCQSTVPGKGGDEQIVAEFNRNGSFGDISLITEAPSTVEITATVDSLVLKLNRTVLVDEIRQNPAFNDMVNTQVSNFMRSERERISPASGSIISIGSAESSVGKSIFGLNLAAVLHEETDGEVCLVDFSRRPSGTLDQEVITEPRAEIDWFREGREEHPFDFPVFSANFPESVSEGAIRAFLGTLTDEVLHVVVVLPSGLNPVIRKILSSSDSVYFLTTDSEQAIYETDLMMSQVLEELDGRDFTPEVVLNHSTQTTSTHRNKIAEQLGVPVRHQLRSIEDDYVDSFETEPPYVVRNPDHPFSKTTRRIAHEAGRRSLGLALGSGAARGLAHIGVLEVLESEGIRPDRIAGSSMGALIAAAYALGHGADRMYQHAVEFHENGGFFRFTDLKLPPNRSILRSTRIRNFLTDIFGDKTFDDTEIPLSITVSRLNNASVEVVTEGSIVEAVMASISIPMIFEPVLKDGSTYIDGGIMDPVPVEPLKNEGMEHVVAVNPVPPRSVLNEQQSERLRPRKSVKDFHPLIKAIFPFGSNNLIDVGMRTIEAIEARLSERSTQQADVVIDPYLTELSWFDFDEYDLFVEQGRRSAREQIPNVKSLVGDDIGSLRGTVSGKSPGDE